MLTLPHVIIWLLSITLGGLMITGAFLIVTRDKGQRASGTRSTARRRQVGHDPREHSLTAARTRSTLRALPPAMAPVRPWDDDGEWAHATCPECGVSWDLPSAACPARIWNVHPRSLPPAALAAIDPASVEVLSRALIGASVRKVYADIEARQVRQLAQTAWATW